MAVGSVVAGRAYVIISALDKTQAGLASAREKMEGFMKKYNSMSADLLSKGTTMAGAAAGAMAAPWLGLQQYAEFDRVMLAVQAKMHTTADGWKELSDLARKYGRDTSWTAAQVAQDMLSMASMGLNEQQVKDLTPNTLNLGRAVQADDLGVVSEVMVGTMKTYNAQMSESAHYADVMTQAINGSSLTFNSYMETLKMCAPIAADAGVSIEQLSAGIMAMSEANIKGSTAGTAMRTFLLRLAKKDDFLTGYGIHVFDEKGALKSFDQIFSDIQARVQTLNQKEKLNFFNKVFGVYATSGMLKMFSSQDIGMFLNQLRNCDGVAAETAKHMESGIWGSLQRIYSAIADVMLTFGKAFAGPVMVMESCITGVANWLSKWIDLTQGWIRLVYMAIGIIGGVGLVLVAAGLAIKMWSIGITLATVACTAFVKVLAIIPTLLTLINGLIMFLFTPLGAIALLAGVLLYNFTNFFGILGSSIQGFVDLLSQGKIEAAWELLCLGMKDLWLDFSHSVVGMWLWVIKKVMGMISNIGPLWKQMMGDVTYDQWAKALDEDYNRAGVENQKRIETLKKKVSEANVWKPADLQPLSEDGTLPAPQLGPMSNGMARLQAAGGIGAAITSAITAGTSEFYQKFQENRANAQGQQTLETIADHTGSMADDMAAMRERMDDMEDFVGI